jgi:hypothetical protein
MNRGRSYDCVWLLGSLIGVFVLQPYLGVFSSLPIPVLSRIDSRVLGVIAFSAVLLLGVKAVSDRRGQIWTAIGVATPAFIANWLSIAVPTAPQLLHTASNLLMIGFLGYVGVSLLRYVVSTSEVSKDQLAGAVSIYFILGIAWSLVYSLIELKTPGSFNGLGSPDMVGSDLMYYSFVTLTTLGYGEITPATLEARVFAALEAVFGVIYIATLVSRLVSLYRRPAE